MALMDIPQPWILSTDRTEWSFGNTRFNILMLGVVHNGVAYSVVWTMLNKKGNSNSDERMDLLDRFEQIFPNAEVAYISGEREFVGREWLTYLLIEPTIPFRLRIRESDRIDNGKKQLRARTRMRPSRRKTTICANALHCLCPSSTWADPNLILQKISLGAFGICFCFTPRRWRVVNCDFPRLLPSRDFRLWKTMGNRNSIWNIQD